MRYATRGESATTIARGAIARYRHRGGLSLPDRLCVQQLHPPPDPYPNHMHCTAALTLNRYRHRGGLSSRGRLCPVQRLHPPRAGRARVHAYMCSRAGGLGILPPMEGLKPLSCAISTEECCAHSLWILLNFCPHVPCDHVSDTNGSLRTAL